MKKTSKYALLAAAALSVAASAQAYVNGDLLVGFTGDTSDFIYDLGNVSLLSQSGSWTIGSGLGTEFGVVGSLNTGQHIFATSFDSAENGFAYSTANRWQFDCWPISHNHPYRHNRLDLSDGSTPRHPW